MFNTFSDLSFHRFIVSSTRVPYQPLDSYGRETLEGRDVAVVGTPRVGSTSAVSEGEVCCVPFPTSPQKACSIGVVGKYGKGIPFGSEEGIALDAGAAAIGRVGSGWSSNKASRSTTARSYSFRSHKNAHRIPYTNRVSHCKNKQSLSSSGISHPSGRGFRHEARDGGDRGGEEEEEEGGTVPAPSVGETWAMVSWRSWKRTRFISAVRRWTYSLVVSENIHNDGGVLSLSFWVA